MGAVLAIIIVIVLILLTYWVLTSDTKTRYEYVTQSSPQFPLSSCGIPQREQAINKAIQKNLSYDEMTNKAMAEQNEFFQVCDDSEEIKKVAECVCAGQDSFSFAENDYGKPGMDYKSFVTSQAVSDDVIRNHAQYLADKQQTENVAGSFLTGRTMSPDSHDSYDPIPWIGLRRPQYVEMCNPTQVPDVDVNLYKGNRQFCFKT